MTQKEREREAEWLTSVSHEAREILEQVEVGLCQILLGDRPSPTILANIKGSLEHALSKLTS
jgi:hypothetical protein